MFNPDGQRDQSEPVVKLELPTDQLEEFRQSAIEWAKASEAARVFLILEPLSALTDLSSRPEDYFQRMREAFEKEAACRDRYFKAVQAILEAQRKNGKRRSQ